MMKVVFLIIFGLSDFISENLSNELTVALKVKNFAGHPIEVFRVSDQGNDFRRETKQPIRNATETSMDLLQGHRYAVRFLDDIISKDSAEFVKDLKEEILMVNIDPIQNKLDLYQITISEILINNTKLITSDCFTKYNTSENFTDCVAERLQKSYEKLHKDVEEIDTAYDNMADRMRNYTCVDSTLETSLPISSHDMSIGEKLYTVNTMFNTSHAKIWTIDDFVTADECEQFIEHGLPRLERATVSGQDGGSDISLSRKAQQAGLNLMRRPDHPLWNLYHRILHVTNAHTGFRLQPDGQEDFTIIQYNPTDQYTPHCDGACEGESFKPGGRIATALLYCKAPEKGGSTTFTKADVFVKPKPGMATFFSYRGPDGLMDSGFTQHSGCPVIEGEKWVVTLWMRGGVNKEYPWTSYDPEGLVILQGEEEEEEEDYVHRIDYTSEEESDSDVEDDIYKEEYEESDEDTDIIDDLFDDDDAEHDYGLGYEEPYNDEEDW